MKITIKIEEDGLTRLQADALHKAFNSLSEVKASYKMVGEKGYQHLHFKAEVEAEISQADAYEMLEKFIHNQTK